MPTPVAATHSPVTTLTVSGKSEQRIAAWAAALADWMSGQGAEVPLADIAHTVNLYRSRHNKIATVSARDRDEAVAGLRALAVGRPTPGVVAAHDVPRGKGTVFLYSGQGSQWAGMGRQLFAEEPAFAAAVDELEPDFVAQVGFSLREVLLAGEPVVGIDRIQPVLVGMQLALTALWRSYGVEPDAVIGHSMGEVTAAVVSGALSPADGLKVIATRSKLMSRLSGQGAMALLELGAAEAEKLVGEHPDITVAVYAAPQQTVIAGPPDQVDAVVAIVDGQGKLARRVEVDVASHHPTVDPILADLKDALADLKPHDPDDSVDQHGRPVRRCRSANSTRTTGWSTCATRCGSTRPSPPLPKTTRPSSKSARTRCSATPSTARWSRPSRAAASIVSGTLTRDNPETLTFHTQLATVRPPSVAAAQNAGGTKKLIDLPPTPWQHVRYWAAPTRRPTGSRPAPTRCWAPTSSCRRAATMSSPPTSAPSCVPYMLDHKVHGQPVMPGTGFGEIALAAACEALGLPATSVSRRRRGRADAAAGRVDSADHSADPRREGRRRDPRRNPLPLGHRGLDPPCRRESRSGAVGATDRAARVVGPRHGALARRPVFGTARHRPAPRRRRSPR